MFFVVAWRLFDIQVLRHEKLSEEARENTAKKLMIEPRRGDVMDCKGHLLATSVPVKTVCVNPFLLTNSANPALLTNCANPYLLTNHMDEVIPLLSPLLQISEAELRQKLQPRTWLDKKKPFVLDAYNRPKPNCSNAFVMLKRKVSVEDWERINTGMSNISMQKFAVALKKKEISALTNIYRLLRNRAVFTDAPDEQIRVFPNGQLAAHVLGYDGEGVENNGDKPVNVLVGESGVEKLLDKKLRGARGWLVTEKDKQQREIRDKRQQDVGVHDGLNAVLTIDLVIQNILETALEDGMRRFSPISISGIVVRPKTGEILAMASLPTYDPNKPGSYPPESRKNIIVGDVHEPGSTFKIVTVAGALNDRLVKLTTPFYCERGRFEYGGKMLRDHESYTNLTVQEIITKSSNIGAAKVGIILGQQRLYNYIRAFGFGAATGVLPQEVNGLVYPPEGWGAETRDPGRGKWSALSITRIPMGHEVGVTSMQMTMAMCAVANNGVLMEPMLVSKLMAPDGSVQAQYGPKVAWRAVNEEAAHDMVAALKSVVNTDGTAALAALTNYTVAGKTGTAQKPDKNGGYSDKFYSSFIGFFPADNPELCIYVSLDAPKGEHVGGKSAAPIFHAIAEKAANYLNIRPDKGNPTGVPETPVTQKSPPIRATATILPRLTQ